MSPAGPGTTGPGWPWPSSAGSSTNSLCTNNCISQTSCAMGQTAPCWTVGTPDVVPGSTENATTGYFRFRRAVTTTCTTQQGSSGWKAYGESMPSSCFIASAGGDSTGDAYHPRHIPALYYTNLNGGSTFSGTNCNSGTQMASNAVPLALTTDNTGRYTSGTWSATSIMAHCPSSPRSRCPPAAGTR